MGDFIPWHRRYSVPSSKVVKLNLKNYFVSPFLFSNSNIPLYIDFVYSDVIKEILTFHSNKAFHFQAHVFGGKNEMIEGVENKKSNHHITFEIILINVSNLF